MNKITFTSFLTSNIDLDETLLAELTSNCQTSVYKKGAFLLKEGENCHASFFIEKGLVKQYGIDRDGKEHITQFAPEGWFVADRDSLYFKTPSGSYIQAIEDTSTFIIDEFFIQKLAKIHPDFTEFNNKLLHNHIRQLTKRIYQLLSASAEERYLSFTKTYPDVSLRVPQTMIASYLGITPESLSRVRKALAHKNFRK